MSGITEKQEKYIRILSSYDSTKAEDEADIKDFLDNLGRDDISLLSVREASDLIQLLLRRPTEYTFLCGKKAELDKSEVNSYNLLGELEACSHGCPSDEIQSIYDCPEWKDEVAQFRKNNTIK